MKPYTILIAGPPNSGKRTFLSCLSPSSPSPSSITLPLRDILSNLSYSLTFTLSSPSPDGLILLYDLTDYNSFVSLKSASNFPSPKLFTYLIGTKLDLEDQHRAVEQEEA